MKNNRFILLFASLLLASCASGGESSISSLPSDTIPVFSDEEGKDSLPSRPATVTLPQQGDEAPGCLEFEGDLVRASNQLLHEDASLLPGKWNNYGIHAPYVFKDGQTYYLYSSSPDRTVGVRGYKSTDLVHWSFCEGSGLGMGYLVRDKRSGNAKAPKMLFHNGSYYLYFNNGNGHQVYVGETPEGPFTFLKSLGDNSQDEGVIYKAAPNRYFFFGGGSEGIYVYAMDENLNVDSTTKTLIEATKKPPFANGDRTSTSPSLLYKDGTLHLVFSRIDEDMKSFRSYSVAAIKPDFSSPEALGNSFFNNHRGPLLLNTEEEQGYVGIGHLGFVEGTDLASTYAVYTSLDHEGERSLNFDPIRFSGSDLSIAPRKSGSLGYYAPTHVLPLIANDNRILSEAATEQDYSALFQFGKIQELNFSYSGRNTNYFVEQGNDSLVFGYRENGLKTVLSEVADNGSSHTVKVDASYGKVSVDLDGAPVISSFISTIPLAGKIAYTLGEEYDVGYTAFTNSSSLSAPSQLFQAAESPIYGSTYLQESKLSGNSGVFTEESRSSSCYGAKVLRLATNRDNARYVCDVAKSGRYAVEFVLNYDFAYYSQSLGVRVGKQPEVIYKTSAVEGSRYVRILGPEFTVEKGLNELFIESLSAGNLDLVSVRLVPVSTQAPSFEHSLSTYADSGISYLSDFVLQEDPEFQQALSTYESVNHFAYVGKNTISNFRMRIEVAISSLPNPDSAVLLGFRCSNYCSSHVDDEDSVQGYLLAIGSNKMTLLRANYGDNITLASTDRTLSTKQYFVFEIQMTGNTIQIYKDDTRLISVTDPYAVSSGHLAFGTVDAAVFFRNISITGGQE